MYLSNKTGFIVSLPECFDILFNFLSLNIIDLLPLITIFLTFKIFSQDNWYT